MIYICEWGPICGIEGQKSHVESVGVCGGGGGGGEVGVYHQAKMVNNGSIGSIVSCI